MVNLHQKLLALRPSTRRVLRLGRFVPRPFISASTDPYGGDGVPAHSRILLVRGLSPAATSRAQTSLDTTLDLDLNYVSGRRIRGRSEREGLWRWSGDITGTFV